MKQDLVLHLSSLPVEAARAYCLKALQDYVRDRRLDTAPSSIELETVNGLPCALTYKFFFGSYGEAVKQAGLEPFLEPRSESEKLDLPADLLIAIDSREQQPLVFPGRKTRKQALSVGDYTLAGEYHNGFFVDRKSGADFYGTMSQGFERFKRELDRARQFGFKLYVVTEAPIESLWNLKLGRRKAKTAWAFKRMRELIRAYPDVCQFVFTKDREQAARVTLYLLAYGSKLWGADIQYLML